MSEIGETRIRPFGIRTLSRRSVLGWFAAAGAAFAVAPLLAACGGDDDDDDEPPTATGATTSTTPTSGTGAPTATSGGADASPTSGGTDATPTTSGEAMAAEQILRIAHSEPPNLDPQQIFNYIEIYICMTLFDCLVEVKEGQFLPLAAESWEVSPDGTTFTFTTQPEGKWSDGTPLNANDWEYTFKRLVNPETAGALVFFAYDIVNAAEINSGDEADIETLGVNAIDDSTLEIKLKSPAAYFLHIIALYPMMPVPQAAIEAHAEEWVEPGNMISNGPFKLESWEHDVEVVVSRNENYVGEPPKLEQIVFKVLTDSVPAYENDEVDITLSLGSADIDRIREDADLSEQFKHWAQSLTNWVIFDNANTTSPVGKKEVRQALYLATDREALTQNALKGLYDPAPLLLPPGMPGRNEAGIPTGGVEEAKALLAEAGYPDGDGFGEITLNYAQGPVADIVAQVLQQMWKDNLNIDLLLNRMEVQAFRAFTASLADDTVAYDGYFSGNGSDYNDPQNWHNLLWETSQGDFYNMRFSNPEFDALVLEAVYEQDPEARIAMYEEADLILMDAMPAVPLFYGANNRLVKPYVRDLEWLLVTTDRFLQKIWIAEH